MAFLSLGLGAAAGLLAMPAMAADPVPPKVCTTTNGWAVSTTDGLVYEATANTTTITYTVGARAPHRTTSGPSCASRRAR
jgi:hypothetical protein